MFQLRSYTACTVACVLSLLLPQQAQMRASSTLWTGVRGALVYSAPRSTAPILTRLPGNMPLHITPYNSVWGYTLLWNALDAWVPLAALAPFPSPGATYLVARPVAPDGTLHAPLPFAGIGTLREAAFLRAAPSFPSVRQARLPLGTQVSIDRWTTDETGAAWYHATTVVGSGWVYGDAVTMQRAGVARAIAPGAMFAGKGMWCTYALLLNSSPLAIVRAAVAARLSQLYVEVGGSGFGFYGARGLDVLLPLAHRAGLRVIAWIYPTLENLPNDVALSVAAARYTTVTGDHIDGLAADVETRLDEERVRDYGQVLRATLGEGAPLAIVVYPPQMATGRLFPFATAALSWDTIVPMDYWHLRRRAYSPDEAAAYVRQSVQAIRAHSGPSPSIAVIAQTFDIADSGVNSPSAAEVAAAVAAARAAGAIGVGFFEWNHTTPEEWGVVATL